MDGWAQGASYLCVFCFTPASPGLFVCCLMLPRSQDKVISEAAVGGGEAELARAT